MSEDPVRHYETVSCYRAGAAATIVLNRPEKRNAMNQELLLALGEALRAAAVFLGLAF